MCQNVYIYGVDWEAGHNTYLVLDEPVTKTSILNGMDWIIGGSVFNIKGYIPGR